MRATQYSAFSFSLIARYTLSERMGKLSPERLTAAEVTFVGICFLCYRRCAVKRVQGQQVIGVQGKMEFCKMFSNSDLWIHFLCIDCFTGNLLSSGKLKEMDDGEGNECLGRPVNSL